MQNKFFPSTIIQTIFYILIGFVIATPFAAPLLFFEKQISEVLPKDLPMYLIYVIVMIIIILLAHFINFRRHLNYNYNFKLNKLNLLPFMILIVFSFQLSLNLPFQKIYHSFINSNNSDLFYSWVYITSALMIVPFLEEILFRGIIFKGLLSTYSPNKTIIVSAIIFGFFHGQLSMIPGAIFFGLMFGYIYFKTNSLGLTILLHFAANLSGIIASFLNHKYGNPNFSTISDLYGNVSFLLMVVLLVVFSVCSYIIIKKININPR